MGVGVASGITWYVLNWNLGVAVGSGITWYVLKRKVAVGVGGGGVTSCEGVGLGVRFGVCVRVGPGVGLGGLGVRVGLTVY